MERLIKRLILLSIILSGTQEIRLPYLGMSPFQICIVITGIAIVIYLFNRRIIPARANIFFAFITTVSSIVAYSTSTYKSWANSCLLVGIMSAMFIISIPLCFGVDDIGLLLKTLIRSQYISIIFSIYSYYMFYFQGGIPSTISLPLGMSIQLSKEFLIRAQASYQIRLALPYATPPVLSAVMAICVIVLLVDENLYKTFFRYVLIFSYTVILIFTGSRTGYIGLLVGMIIFVIPKFFENKEISKLLSGRILFFSILSVCVLIYFVISQYSYIDKFFSRLFALEISTDRHFLVPLDGLIIWTSSMRYFFVGIGFGSSINMSGAHTYLPAYFLNSLVTLIVERGLFGVYMVLELIRITSVSFTNRKAHNGHIYGLSAAMFISFIACIFYEILLCYFVIFVISIQYIYINNRSSLKNMTEEVMT